MRIKFVSKAAALAAAFGAVVVLGGCAHPQLVEMGQTQEDVIAYLGEPQAKTAMPDGTVRLTYSVQPFGQEVWWLFVDQRGKVVSREQGLQEKYFNMLTPGKSTEADVWAMWGKCAEKYEFNLVNEHAWMYRFRDKGGFDMAVWPQFDVNGVMQSIEVTEDPWKNNDRNNFMSF